MLEARTELRFLQSVGEKRASKLAEQQRNKAASAQLDCVSSAIVDLSATLQDQRDKLGEMQQNAELLTAEPVAEVRLGDATISQDEVEVAFLREKQRRNRS